MIYRTLLHLSLLFLGVFFTACMPYEEEELTDVSIDLKDTLVQHIYTLQHEQQADSLLFYFQHRNPTYRYLAAQAFASIRDEAYLDTLAGLLTDRVDEVRAAAAYALGQTGSPDAEPLLVAGFDQYDTLGVYSKANRAILEAIGKCGSMENLRMLGAIQTYQAQDTALLEGQSWGIYRYALRGMTVPEVTARMVEMVNDERYPNSVRFIAANYLSRGPNLQFDSTAAPELARIILREEDPRIQMALAIGLGKTGSPAALTALLSLYKLTNDYRLKCNILSAFTNFDYDDVSEEVILALQHPNIHVSARAAQFLLDHGVSRDATTYWRMTRDSLPWQSQISLFAAALRHLPGFYTDYRGALNSQLRKRFAEDPSPFVKVAALAGLTEWPWNLRYIYRYGYQAETPMVRGAAVQALAKISENRNNSPGISSRRVTRELGAYFQAAIESGEPLMMEPAAEALMQPARNFATVFDSLAFLERAIADIDSTEALFTHRALQNALDYLRSGQEPAPGLFPAKPTDWSLLSEYTIAPLALMHTSKGVIHLRLLPEQAPASVANFIELAENGFYNNKYFYRVVPNFVIQGAASTSHDPAGFTIRSELPNIHYDQEGYLGMASAGNHTESTQFFITHSPTPHLDGNYTLFGRVEKGMDVVHNIQKGDQIVEILIR